MSTVAIIGAGDLGGAVAWAVASCDRARRVLLIDSAAAVARGKALDLQQSGAVEGFHTSVEGTDDISRLIACSVCVVADRAATGSPEWQGDEGLALLKRSAAYLGNSPLVFAGASQGELLQTVARELSIPRTRLIGSAPEAFASAARSLVALEARCSARDVALTVLGTPPSHLFVPWGDAAIGGYSLQQVLDQVQLNRLDARLSRVWPPGPYALGTAAACIAKGILESSRSWFAVLTMLNGEFGARNRIGTIPAMLSSSGVMHTRVPALNPRDRVLLGNG